MRYSKYVLTLVLGVAMAIAGAAAASNADDLSRDSLVPALSSMESLRLTPSASLSRLLLDETGLTSMQSQRGLKGSGVSIAVVDTGVDPQVLIPGSIADVVDFTPEGIVTTSEPLAPDTDGVIYNSGRAFDVRGLVSLSGRYRVGVWPQDQTQRSRIEQASLTGLRSVGIVVADTSLPRGYDTVYIDTDGDSEFSDEVPIGVYRESKKFVPISAGSGALALAVADIRNDGQQVVLFFDANGHGTGIASLLVGGRGTVEPLVPDASIIAIKAVDAKGESSWDLVFSGIREACERGADIVVVSASPASSTEGNTETLKGLLAQHRDVLVVMAAGNRGPGVGTLPTISRADNLLIVGGYLPSAISRHMGWGSSETFYPWSSVGPDHNGSVTNVLAAAVAPALRPDWHPNTREPVIMEGTSVSAAYAGGTAAMIAQGLRADSVPNLGARLRRAMEESAVPLQGLTAAEQGHGVIRPEQALQAASLITGPSRTRFVYELNSSFSADAFFERDRVPGRILATLDNLSPVPLNVTVRTPKWISLPYDAFSVPPVDQRQLSLLCNKLEPGLHSGYVIGDDPTTPGRDAESVLTVVVPLDLSSGLVRLDSLISAGQIQREFLTVNPGTESVNLTLSIRPWGQGMGTARMYVYDASGNCVYQGRWVGANQDSSTDEVTIAFPVAGVWEVVVLCDPTLRKSGQDETSVRLEASVGGIASSSHEIPTSTTTGGSSVESAIKMVSFGRQDKICPQIIVEGKNGFVRRGDVRVTPGISAMIPLPRIEDSTDALCLSISGPADPDARISFYIYGLDSATGQWKQVATGDSLADKPGQVVLVAPPPGQYVALVETMGTKGRSTTFTWLAVAAGQGPSSAASEPSGQVSYDWQGKSTQEIHTRVTMADASSSPLFLVVWDEARTMLRSIMPVAPPVDGQQLLVTYSTGSRVGNSVYVTFRAWDCASMRPVDACLLLNGRWYQMSDGYVVVALPESDLNEAEMKAEYPGMRPWVKMP